MKETAADKDSTKTQRDDADEEDVEEEEEGGEDSEAENQGEARHLTVISRSRAGICGREQTVIKEEAHTAAVKIHFVHFVCLRCIQTFTWISNCISNKARGGGVPPLG